MAAKKNCVVSVTPTSVGYSEKKEKNMTELNEMACVHSSFVYSVLALPEAFLHYQISLFLSPEKMAIVDNTHLSNHSFFPVLSDVSRIFFWC